jgi:hypothetical protein
MKHTRRKSNGTRSHLVLLTFFLVAVVALIFTVPIASAGHWLLLSLPCQLHRQAITIIAPKW